MAILSILSPSDFTLNAHPLRRGALLGLLVVLGILVPLWWLSGAGRPVPAPPAGSGSDCRATPRFAERLGYGSRLAISTSERDSPGLVIFNAQAAPDADAAARGRYQAPSWDDAGTLGPFVLDRDGQIYTAAVPRTAVSDNPPGSLNVIYRIDSDTAEMQPFVRLPDTAGSPENPFAILGLAYDCATHALYASTVAGSTRTSEQGRIVRIDLTTRAVTDEVLGVDALGLGVFHGTTGRRLYIGLARSPELGSVALDERGHAVGAFRTEWSVDAPGFADPRIRRISLDQTTMTLAVVPFSFNLRAVSEPQQTFLRYTYDQQHDAWVVAPQPTP